MSGRVGDLSPKQEEALAKVSLLLACLWPSLLAERRLRETVLAGGRLSQGEDLGKFGHRDLQHEQPRRCPLWEEVVAWKPWEAAEGTKATFILRAGRDW